MLKTRVLSLLALTVLTMTGCASTKVVLHPIAPTDITPMAKGVAYAPEKDGYFLSSLYMDEVLQAKVDEVKKTS